jgi:hypothetical protein
MALARSFGSRDSVPPERPNEIRQSRPSLAERLLLQCLISRIVEGLWVGVGREADAKEQIDRIFARVEEALRLIGRHDPPRYKRLLRDPQRVLVLRLPDSSASYNHALAACQIDTRYVLAEDSAIDVIAATIVHEATHARLMSCGIGYAEALRTRVERICVRRELAFAAKLPDGTRVREKAEQTLSWLKEPGYSEVLTNQALEKRFVEGSAKVLHELGVPNWLVKIALAVRALIMKVRMRLPP